MLSRELRVGSLLLPPRHVHSPDPGGGSEVLRSRRRSFPDDAEPRRSHIQRRPRPPGGARPRWQPSGDTCVDSLHAADDATADLRIDRPPRVTAALREADRYSLTALGTRVFASAGVGLLGHVDASGDGAEHGLLQVRAIVAALAGSAAAQRGVPRDLDHR